MYSRSLSIPHAKISALLLSGLASVVLLHPASAASQLVNLWNFEQPGYGRTTLDATDHIFFQANGEWHVFYTHRFTTEEPYRSIGHAVSSNLRDWVDRPDVVVADNSAPDWRSKEVWAPHVVQWPDSGYILTFTGVNDFSSQQLGFMWSSDLDSWSELPQFPPMLPDSSLYFWSAILDVDCRDPHLIFDSGEWHLLYAIRSIEGLASIGRSTTTDLLNWNHHPPLVTWGSAWQQPDIESPGMTLFEGEFYLFMTHNGNRITKQPSLLGPWDYDDAVRIEPVTSGIELFPSGNGLLYSRNRLSSCLGANHVLWIDSLDTSGWPLSKLKPPSLPEFNVIWGDGFLQQPTFGDPPSQRGEPPSGHRDLCWLSSREVNPQPDLIVPCVGDRGSSPQGIAESVVFILTGDTLRGRASTGDASSGVWVGVRDYCTGVEIVRYEPTSPTMMPFQQEVSAFRGQELYWTVNDETSTPGGWIGVDDLQEVATEGLPSPSELPLVAVTQPTLDENLSGGSTKKIRWTASHPSGFAGFDVYYSFDGGETLRFIGSAPGHKSFRNWSVPDTLVFDAIVRVVGRSNDGVSSCGTSEVFDINVTVGIESPTLPAAYLRTTTRNQHTYLEGIAPAEISGEVVLEVYDARGRRIGEPWTGRAGERFSVKAPTRDLDGRSLSTGIYFARLRAPGRFLQSKYVLLD